MNLEKLVLIAILALAAGCAGSPASQETQEVAVRVVDGPIERTADAAEADKDDVVCTRQSQVGSNFQRTVCKTRAQRDAERANSENALRMQQQHNVSGRSAPLRGGGPF